MPYLFNSSKIIEFISRYYLGGKLYPKTTLEKWAEYELFYNQGEEVQLPSATELAEGIELKRIKTRANLTKTVVKTTVGMALSNRPIFYNPEGLRDTEVSKRIEIKDLYKLVRYMSLYGGAWLHAVPISGSTIKPYRIYKPHKAISIPMQGDEEITQAVLVVNEYEDYINTTFPTKRYEAIFYEWNDNYTEVRRKKFVKSDGVAGALAWAEDTLAEQTFNYMPMIFCPNADEDTIEKASDVAEGLPLFKAFSENLTKYIKAAEDEAYRQIFLAGMSREQVIGMKSAGSKDIWYGERSNETENAPNPEMQVAPPSDTTQHVELLKAVMRSVATVTQTSPLELDERPVQDIPAQTLRILSDPQLKRVKQTCLGASSALAKLCEILDTRRVSTDRNWSCEMKPEVPVSQDRIDQTNISMAAQGFSSARQVLRETKKYTEKEIENILEEAYQELERKEDIKARIEAKYAPQVEETSNLENN